MLLIAGALDIAHDVNSGRFVVANGDRASDLFQVATSTKLDKDVVFIIVAVLQSLVDLGLNQISIVLPQLFVSSLLLSLLECSKLDPQLQCLVFGLEW